MYDGPCRDAPQHWPPVFCNRKDLRDDPCCCVLSSILALTFTATYQHTQHCDLINAVGAGTS